MMLRGFSAFRRGMSAPHLVVGFSELMSILGDPWGLSTSPVLSAEFPREPQHISTNRWLQARAGRAKRICVTPSFSRSLTVPVAFSSPSESLPLLGR